MPDRDVAQQCSGCGGEPGSAEHEERCVAKWPEVDQRAYFAAQNAGAGALVCQDCGSSDGRADPEYGTALCPACERARRHANEVQRNAQRLSFEQVPGMPRIGPGT